MSAPYLTVVENVHRGGVETQYAGALYLVREFHRQLGVDLLLRGDAVVGAVRQPRRPALVVGGQQIDSLPDPPRSVEALVEDGMAVFAEAEALNDRGVEERSLLPGVHAVARAVMAGRWPTYRAVWFV